MRIISGTLFLVATPIGNLGDISYRAVQTLGEVDFIAAEDTRVTRKLLAHLEIKKQLVSYYEHNRRESGEKIISRLLAGETCALVSDAGTPGISDPGEELVRLCIEAGISIFAIPGPCAAVTALVLSGLPAGRFVFEGFLSTARKSRFERLHELRTEKRTMVFYEAPHKLARTLSDMLAAFGDRSVAISRELTKLYDETMRCTLSEAAAYYKQTPPRGEFVLIIKGADHEQASEMTFSQAVKAAQALIDKGFTIKDAAKAASEDTGVPKNKIYNAVINNQ